MAAAVQSTKQTGWKRPFFTIWTGQAFSLLGSSLAGFALVWWLTATTGSATVLAGATIMSILPQFLLGPLAGALVDRWPRRVVMIAADSLIALVSLALVILFALERAEFWHVYLVMLVRAVGGAFHVPAMQASTPLMVPEKHLTRVAGINQTFQGALNMVAPPVAALLIGVLPVQGVLLIDVFTALLAVLPLFFIAVPNPPRVSQGAAAKSSLLGEMRAGFRFVWGWTGLALLTAMACLVNFLAVPAMSFVPLLVTRHFGLGALQLGWMETAFGVGVIGGGLLLGVWGGFKNRMMTILAAAVSMGAGLLLTGLAPRDAYALALVGFFCSSLSSTIISGLVFAMVQAVVPPQMQGRVFSILLSGAAGIAPLGLLVAGPVVDALGVPFWFILAGAITGGVGAIGLFIPAMMRLDEQRPADLQAEASPGD